LLQNFYHQALEVVDEVLVLGELILVSADGSNG
jgi:hypothetical protein